MHDISITAFTAYQRVFDWANRTWTPVWDFFYHLLTRDGEELSRLTEISLSLTLFTCAFLIGLMIYFRPKTPLERSLLAREIGFTLVIGMLFTFRFFDFFSRPIYVVGYFVLAFAAIAIAINSLREHRNNGGRANG